MTQDQQIKEIREACIKANPDKGICKRHDIRMADCFSCQMSDTTIHLADVLLALHELQHDGSYLISDAGFFAHFKAQGAAVHKALKVFECEWNLRADDLTHQSPETIEFLYELLK